MKKLQNIKIVLGSQSPRRAELLKQMNINFRIHTMATPELVPPEIPSTEVAKYLANLKAQPLLAALQADELLLTSDTVVLLEGEILGKPTNPEDAFDMLSRLSGNKSAVTTGVFLGNNQYFELFDVTTEVYFHPLTPAEINYYISNFHPFDKAGAYGIQEWIGQIGIEKIVGCYYNVMGLPTSEIWQRLDAM
jgi:septum formation protein